MAAWLRLVRHRGWGEIHGVVLVRGASVRTPDAGGGTTDRGLANEMLSQRSTVEEELDHDGTDAATYRRVVAELAVVNRITLTHRPTLRWLAKASEGMSEFSVLDVGHGHGDLLRAIARWADRRDLRVKLSGIDQNPRSAVAAGSATPCWMAIDYQTADVLSCTPSEPLDFIVSSQMTHHLSDHQVVEFLRWLEAHSRHGWHITDLHRHALPYYTFPILCRVMRWHRITRSDGVISVARGFRRRDWHTYLNKAGLQANVSWYAFRFCVKRVGGKPGRVDRH